LKSPLSTVDRAAGLIKRLGLEEWQALRGLERCVLSRVSTSTDSITKHTAQPRERTEFGLSELNKKGMVGTSGHSWVLYGTGLDLLALKYYADEDYATALGKLIAKGKESDVYEVLSSKGKLYALKFFRLGRTSFREITRKRASSSMQTWIDSNYKAAERESSALSRLDKVTENVPSIIDHNRHTILTGELPAVRLSTRPDLSDPKRSFLEVLETVRQAFLKAGMINGDLSEYNILTDTERVWLIDWPQWVGTDHPNADELLARDVGGVTRFFARTYGLKVDLESALGYVKGKRKAPAVRRG